jgi:hypothetical protein
MAEAGWAVLVGAVVAVMMLGAHQRGISAGRRGAAGQASDWKDTAMRWESLAKECATQRDSLLASLEQTTNNLNWATAELKREREARP